ncbi:aldehyde dehydrogenase family protein [Gordonia sp. NPDC003376]
MSDQHFSMFIDGEPRDTAAHYEIRNPATGGVAATVARGGVADAADAVAAATREFETGTWSSLTCPERAAILGEIAARLAEETPALCELESLANGATIRQTQGFHVGMAAAHAAAVAQQVAAFVPDREVEVPALPTPSAHRQRSVPVGVVAAIIPWNFPLLLSIWKVFPALGAGCTVVVKVDERAPLTVLRLARIAVECGVPAGVLNVITGDGAEVGAYLTTHPDVAKITFTGSTAVGRQIMSDASASIKNLTLELGGKAPMVALDDADLDLIADGSLFASMLYSGQICVSGTRLLVPRHREQEIVDRLCARVSTLRLGDPADPATDVGPVISERQRDRILDYVESAVDQGAQVVAGGGTAEIDGFSGGFWVEPTVIAGVDNQMTIAREEVFGPVLIVIPYDDEEQAVAIANDTAYGLSAGVWAGDLEHGADVARRLRAGTVWVNDWHLLHPMLPFGGFKQSGSGRELGPDPLSSFVEQQHLHVGLGESVDEHIFAILLSTPVADAQVASA